jgi:uncharacterized membrane protein YphA (DoxX/SURF4 family)
MKYFLLIILWFVGLLFIFSGLVKANDPLGLAYKMQEFFEVLGMHALHDYALYFSLFMNVFEVVAGVAVIIGWQMRLFSWLLLLLIIFFTFLTGFALFSGKIKTCGCFGDCIPLTAAQSFMKDLLLLVLILILFFVQHKIKASVSPIFSVLILTLGLVGSIALQYYALNYLPVVDCLPYKKGNNLIQQMQTPAGAIPDSFSLNFVYQKNGKTISFDQAHFPNDFDSSYIYVDRKDVLVKKGNNLQAPIANFSLQTISGVDPTKALFETDQYILVVARDFEQYESWKDPVNKIINVAIFNNIPVYMVTSDAVTASEKFGQITVLKCDATVLKTIARVIPTIYFMEKAVVKSKFSYLNIEEVLQTIITIRK